MSKCVWCARFPLKAIFLCIIVALNLHTIIGDSDLESNSTKSSELHLLTDNFTILDANNFSKTVYHSETSWFVAFFPSSIGYLHRFMNDFTKSINEWKNVVKVAVIYSELPVNKDLCQENNISHGHGMRYFAANGSFESNKGLAMIWYADVGVMRSSLVEQLQVQQREHRDTHKWPNLQPFTGPEVENVWDNVKDTVKYIFLIYERSSSDLASEMILDFNEITNLLIRRVIPRYETNPRHKIFPAFSDIRQLLLSKNFVDIGEVPKDSNPEIGTTQKPIIPKLRLVHQEDLELALRHLIRQEIPMVEEIDGERMKALKNFLDALAKYFPAKHGNSTFLEALSSVVNSKESISGKDFAKLVNSTENEISPVYPVGINYEWLGCKGSLANSTGYPCGLWKLFHALTVSFAAKNENNSNVEPTQILRAIYGYVEHFFACENSCQEFFQWAARSNISEVKDLNENIIWLWNTHAKVTVLIKARNNEYAEAYPSANHCPMCLIPLTGFSEGYRWNKGEVQKFFKTYFSHSGILNGNSSLLIRQGISSNETIKISQNIDIPAIFVVDRENTVNLLNITKRTRQGLRIVIQEFMLSKNLNVDIGEVPKDPRPEIMTTPKPIIPKLHLVHQQDLELASRHSIRQEIPMVEEIDGERMKALKNFLNALAKYFPVKHGNSTFLEELSSVVNSKESISGKDFAKLVNSTENEISPVYPVGINYEWLGCKGSLANSTGYPCGLWKLFHALTVSFAAKNENNSNVEPTQILRAIYGYVEHFFACENSCQEFFQWAARSNISEVKDLNENIIWLWNTHAEVTVLIKARNNEYTEAYPSANHCPMCLIPLTGFSEGYGWNEGEVQKFFKTYFSPSGILNGNSSAA